MSWQQYVQAAQNLGFTKVTIIHRETYQPLGYSNAQDIATAWNDGDVQVLSCLLYSLTKYAKSHHVSYASRSMRIRNCWMIGRIAKRINFAFTKRNIIFYWGMMTKDHLLYAYRGKACALQNNSTPYGLWCQVIQRKKKSVRTEKEYSRHVMHSTKYPKRSLMHWPIMVYKIKNKSITFCVHNL